MSTELETYQNQVSKLYIAFFGRVPEADGFNFWVNALANGAELSDLAGGFVGSQEFETAYGDVSAREAVSRFYENTLNREADPEGLAFWAGAVTGSTPFYDIANAIISTAFGGGPGVNPLDQALVENKVIVANYVADTLASNDAELIATALDGVTADPASVQAALARLFALANPQSQPDQPGDSQSEVDTDDGGGGGGGGTSTPSNPTYTFNTGDVTAGDTVMLSTSGTDTFEVQTSVDFDELNTGALLSGLDVISIAQGQTAKFLSAQVTGLTLAVNGQGDGTATFRVDASSDAGETLDLGNATVVNTRSVLNGGAGDDTIVGTNANDTIAGGAGADEINGGAGDDVYYFTESAQVGETIEDASGYDRIVASAPLGLSNLNAGAALTMIEEITVDPGSSFQMLGSQVDGLTINLNKQDTASAVVDFFAQGTNIDLSNFTFNANGQTAFTSGIASTVRLIGDEGGEILIGTSHNDEISGEGGNDTIVGGEGEDTVLGATGDDTFLVYGTAQQIAADSIDGGSGTNIIRLAGIESSQTNALIAATFDFDRIDNVLTIEAADGANREITLSPIAETTAQTVVIDGSSLTSPHTLSVQNEAASDTTTFSITGGAGADTLAGSDGNDTIAGGEGDNRLEGGKGSDTITGGTGSNTYVYNIDIVEEFSDSAPGNADQLTDFDLTKDLIEIRATGVSQFAGVEADFLSLGKFNPHAYRVLFVGGDPLLNLDKQVAIDLPAALTATQAADVTRLVLTGTGGDDVVAGGNGADQFFMLGGNDTVRADDNDMIDGGDGEDTVIFTAPVDSAKFSDSDLVNVEVVSLEGDLSGGVDLSAQTERLVVVGDDDDTVVMSSGGGTARGKLGKDIFTAGASKDTFIIHTVANSAVAAGLNESAVSEFDEIHGFDPTEDRLQIVGTNVSTFATNQIFGGASTTLIPDGTAPNNNQVIWIDINANELIYAGVGPNTEGGDVFVYLPGQTLSSADAAAIVELNLTGTAGNDTISTGALNDTLSGGAGDDALSGGAGADSIDGGDGIDTVSYAESDAAVTVTLNGSSNSGGHAQGDVLSNVEILVGSDFDDTLSGSGTNNTLVGGLGADELDGLFGGAATYRYDTIADSAAAVSGTDRTFDVIPFFDRTDTPDGNADFIDLSAVNTALTGGTAATSINIVDDTVGGTEFYTFADFEEVANHFNNNWNLPASGSAGLEAVYFEIRSFGLIDGHYLLINNNDTNYTSDDLLIKLSDGAPHDGNVSPVATNFVL